MLPSRPLSAALLALGLALPATAQTPDSHPTTPASPGLVAAPRPASRTAPGPRARAATPDSILPTAKMRALPKPTAAERAEKRRLEHDLRICIGC